MAAAFTQQGKRQKVRDGRIDNVDYFQGVDKIEYNMAGGANAAVYRHYSQSERVLSRSMEDWLRLSLSLSEFRDCGHKPPYRNWDDGTNSLDNNKRCLKALLELCTRLGVRYWTARDTDLVPISDSWEENRANWEEMVEYIQELNQRMHCRLLWLAPDLHSHYRYTSGALTSNDASTFIQAASQMKKCLEISQRLSAECFLISPYREGYDSIFQNDVAKEIKLFSKLLKIIADYKERLNYRCQMLIKPYYSCNNNSYTTYSCNSARYWRENELVNNYMWDVTSCLYFLKFYNLERYYKVCSPPGHHMYMANVYNMLGGVVIPNEFDYYDNKTLTLMMKCIIDQGSPPAGGISLHLRPVSLPPRAAALSGARAVDAAARGLRRAAAVAGDQAMGKALQQRYASYHGGFGARLLAADLTLEECDEFCKKNQQHAESSKSENLDLVFQRHLDACDHV